MTRDLVIRAGDRDRVLARFRELAEDPTEVMKVVGIVIASSAERAFEEQGIPGDPWLPRYPNQNPPKVNKAGLVSDLLQGSSIKGRRFTDRPALMDTGRLLRSLAWEQSVDTRGSHIVEVGSNVPYASIHQFGGTSRQPLTPVVKDGIWKFINTEQGSPYYLKLLPLVAPKNDVLETEVWPRPFLGMWPELAREIADTVEEEFVDGVT